MRRKEIYDKTGNLIEEKHHKFYDEYKNYEKKKWYENAQIVARLTKKTGSYWGISFVEPHDFAFWLFLKLKKESTTKC